MNKIFSLSAWEIRPLILWYSSTGLGISFPPPPIPSPLSFLYHAISNAYRKYDHAILELQVLNRKSYLNFSWISLALKSYVLYMGFCLWNWYTGQLLWNMRAQSQDSSDTYPMLIFLALGHVVRSQLSGYCVKRHWHCPDIYLISCGVRNTTVPIWPVVMLLIPKSSWH